MWIQPALTVTAPWSSQPIAQANILATVTGMNPAQELRHAAIEHAMRVTSNDALVLPFLGVSPGSPEAHSALGRLLGENNCELVSGSPLVAFVTDHSLDQNWRLFCPPVTDSLFDELSWLSRMYYQPKVTNPYEALEELRCHEEKDLVAVP